MSGHRATIPTVGSTWEDRFDSHQLWSLVDTMGSILSDQLPKDLDGDQRQSVARLKTAHELLSEHREKGLKEFYTPTMLDVCVSQMSNNVVANMQNFVSDPPSQAGTLAVAATNVEAVFDCIATWPPLPAGGQANAAGRAFSEYKKDAETALEVLHEKNGELKTELEQIRSQLAAAEAQIQNLVSRYTDSLEERDSEYSSAVLRVEESGKTAYDKAIEDDLDARKDDLDTLKAEAQALVSETRTQRNEAERLAKAAEDSTEWLAKRAFARDFGMQARRKSGAAWVYDFLGIGVIAAPVFFVLKHFLDNQDTDGTVAVSLTRLSIILGAVILGGYLFNRGATNHRQARASKSAEIRLNTFEAFISALTEDEQAEIRNGMAQTIYLRGRLADDEPDSSNHQPFSEILDAISSRRVKGQEETKP